MKIKFYIESVLELMIRNFKLPILFLIESLYPLKENLNDL